MREKSKKCGIQWLLFVCTVMLVFQLTTCMEVYAAPKVSTPKVVSVKEKGSTKAIIKWKKVKGASGYKIYRSTNGKKWKVIKTVNGNKKTTYTDVKLKKGTRYYYKVRACKTVNGKKYWSASQKKSLRIVAGLSKLNLNKTNITLKKGETYTLKVKSTSVKPKWSSDNAYYASVDAQGKVTAANEGTAIITAKIDKKVFSCKVTVVEIKENEVKETETEAKETETEVKETETEAKETETETKETESEEEDYGTQNKYSMLLSHLNRSNLKDTYGNPYMMMEMMHDGITFTWSVKKNLNLGTVTFWLSYEHDGTDYLVAMTHYNNESCMQPSFYVTFTPEVWFTARAYEYSKANYTKNSTISFYISEISKINTTASALQGVSNENLKLAFAGWDQMLYDQVGIGMKNLGFTSY